MSPTPSPTTEGINNDVQTTKAHHEASPKTSTQTIAFVTVLAVGFAVSAAVVIAFAVRSRRARQRRAKEQRVKVVTEEATGIA